MTPRQNKCDSGESWTRFQRGCAAGQLLLLAATFKLWWVDVSFPPVPMASFPTVVFVLQPFYAITLAGSLLCIALQSRPNRFLFAVTLIAWIALFATNQHRLQPWAYQAALWNLAFCFLHEKSAKFWLSATTISIYAYSSCGKFDFQFLHTVGQDFLATFMGPVGESVTKSRVLLAALLPATELAIAIGLIVPRTRRQAGIAAMLMHASLLILLGPWLKSHSWGVVWWNALLIPHAWYLFVKPQPIATPEHLFGIQAKTKHWRPKVIPSCFLFAMILPMWERAGYWDHWLSWSLYSPHTSRVELEVHQTMIDKLPKELASLIEESGDEPWKFVPLEKWSLLNLGVPIYPQARFQLGVAIALAEQNELGDGVRAKILSVADRWTGVREEKWLVASESLKKAAGSYWALPSSNFAATRGND